MYSTFNDYKSYILKDNSIDDFTNELNFNNQFNEIDNLFIITENILSSLNQLYSIKNVINKYGCDKATMYYIDQDEEFSKMLITQSKFTVSSLESLDNTQENSKTLIQSLESNLDKIKTAIKEFFIKIAKFFKEIWNKIISYFNDDINKLKRAKTKVEEIKSLNFGDGDRLAIVSRKTLNDFLSSIALHSQMFFKRDFEQLKKGINDDMHYAVLLNSVQFKVLSLSNEFPDKKALIEVIDKCIKLLQHYTSQSKVFNQEYLEALQLSNTIIDENNREHIDKKVEEFKLKSQAIGRYIDMMKRITNIVIQVCDKAIDEEQNKKETQ